MYRSKRSSPNTTESSSFSICAQLRSVFVSAQFSGHFAVEQHQCRPLRCLFEVQDLNSGCERWELKTEISRVLWLGPHFLIYDSSFKQCESQLLWKNCLVFFLQKSFQLSFYDYFLRKYREQIAESSVGCDAILDPRRIKFLQVGKLGARFCLSKKRFSSVKRSNLKIFFDYDVIKPLDVTHPGEVTNRA